MEELRLYFKENPLVLNTVVVTIAAIVIWLGILLIRSRYLVKIKESESRYRANKIAGLFGFLLFMIVAMVVFRNSLGGVFVAFGVIGAGVAFALQEVITSVAGWMAISFGGFYTIGDRVQLGGIKGDVIDIGVLRTTLMETGEWVQGDLYNGRIVLIANSFVFKEPVFNYSGDFPFLWDEIKIPIQYGSDYKMVRQVLTDIGKETVGDYAQLANKNWEVMVKKYMIENASTEPMVSLVANDNWVEFTLRYVVEFKKRRKTKDELYSRILDAVDASEGKIKFASATFHLVEAPEFKVKIN